MNKYYYEPLKMGCRPSKTRKNNITSAPVSIDFLNSTQGYEWLTTPDGKKWLGSQSHQVANWLLKPEGSGWFASPKAEGLRQICDQYIVTHIIISCNTAGVCSSIYHNIFSVSKYLVETTWVTTRAGLVFLKSSYGAEWLRNSNYETILRMEKWFYTSLGKEFLNSENGQIFIRWFKHWKDSSEGSNWLNDNARGWIDNAHIKYVLNFEHTT